MRSSRPCDDRAASIDGRPKGRPEDGITTLLPYRVGGGGLGRFSTSTQLRENLNSRSIICVPRESRGANSKLKIGAEKRKFGVASVFNSSRDCVVPFIVCSKAKIVILTFVLGKNDPISG